MRRFLASSVTVLLGTAALYACSAGSGSNFGTGDDSGGGTSGEAGVVDDGGNNGDVGSLGDGNHGDTGTVTTTSIIYANSDTELYSMDPMTLMVKDIGPFMGVGGATAADKAVTDIAVNGNDEVWVNTETVIYQATLPSGGTGPVQLAKKATISVATGQKFYALAFATAGVLGTGEGLVAGDSKGDLYYIDTGTGTPQLLGGFGKDANNNPWQLSGDLVFYTQNGVALGLATIRSCPVVGTTTRCSLTNDYLASIDIAAMTAAFTSRAPATTLLKKIYGTGTGFGDLFGVGAWGDKVYAFGRVHGGDAGIPAQLVSIDGTGKGTSLQTFASLTAGWSGAGVTTKATITVPPPPP